MPPLQGDKNRLRYTFLTLSHPYRVLQHLTIILSKGRTFLILNF